MSSEISADEAAVLTAAVIAYLSKPSSIPVEQIKPADQARTSVVRGVETVTPDLRETILSLNRRVGDLESEIRILKNKIERLERERYPTETVRISRSKSRWVLTARHEACDRIIIKNSKKHIGRVID
ncbi:MAG: hypothetical protein QXU67_06475 [Candidatus Bathyarchaeia archaeon]